MLVDRIGRLAGGAKVVVISDYLKGAISRQVAHYAGHAYQILLLAKHLQGANWKTLSIPRGQSEEFNRRMLAKQKADL